MTTGASAYQLGKLDDILGNPTRENLENTLEELALDLADEIVTHHHHLDQLLVVGMGGDFEEFSATTCASLENHGFKLTVNCFWPYRTINPNLTGLGDPAYDFAGNLTGEELIYFDGSYIENPNSSFQQGIILASFVSDPEPIRSVVRRTKEVFECENLELRCLVAEETALDELRNFVTIKNPMMTVEENRLDYWNIEDLLDQRAAKLVPRQSRWLMGRRFPELRLGKVYGLRI